jgi:hypothetical protein
MAEMRRRGADGDEAERLKSEIKVLKKKYKAIKQQSLAQKFTKKIETNSQITSKKVTNTTTPHTEHQKLSSEKMENFLKRRTEVIQKMEENTSNLSRDSSSSQLNLDRTPSSSTIATQPLLTSTSSCDPPNFRKGDKTQMLDVCSKTILERGPSFRNFVSSFQDEFRSSRRTLLPSTISTPSPSIFSSVSSGDLVSRQPKSPSRPVNFQSYSPAITTPTRPTSLVITSEESSLISSESSGDPQSSSPRRSTITELNQSNISHERLSRNRSQLSLSQNAAACSTDTKRTHSLDNEQKSADIFLPLPLSDSHKMGSDANIAHSTSTISSEQLSNPQEEMTTLLSSHEQKLSEEDFQIDQKETQTSPTLQSPNSSIHLEEEKKSNLYNCFVGSNPQNKDFVPDADGYLLNSGHRICIDTTESEEGGKEEHEDMSHKSSESERPDGDEEEDIQSESEDEQNQNQGKRDSTKIQFMENNEENQNIALRNHSQTNLGLDQMSQERFFILIFNF